MTARCLTKAHGGDWTGTYGLLPGPGHSKRDRSLKVWDTPEGVRVHSFAGDDWRDCKAYLGIDEPRAPQRPQTDNSAHALEIWRASRPAPGTPVDTYLRPRGITIEPPPALRYHPDLAHKPTGLMFPAMVAGVVRADRELTAVHRVYLLPDGRGKAQRKPVETG